MTPDDSGGARAVPYPSAEGRRELWAGVSVVLALSAFFLVLEARNPHYFLWDDNASFFLPSYAYDLESLTEHGRLAHLDYHQYLGYTYLASGQTGVLYPPVYLGMALAQAVGGDLRHGIDILAILHFLAAGVGMFVLCRRFRVPRWTSVALACTWCTFPFLLQVSRNWIFVSFTAAHLPWCFWLLDRLVERPGPRRALAFAVAKALFFFQGYVQYFVMATLFEGLYLGLRWLHRAWSATAESAIRAQAEGEARSPWKSMAREGGWFGIACGLTAILAAPLLLPMLVAKERSAYRAGALSLEEFLSNALEPTVFLASQLGTMRSQVVHWASGAIYYVGLPHLILLALTGIACLFGWRRRPKRAEGRDLQPEIDRRGIASAGIDPRHGVAAWVAFLALLASTELYGWAHSVPVLSSFRWPFKFFLFFLFYAVIALGGIYGAMASSPRRWVRGLAIAFLALGLVGNGFIAGHSKWDLPFGPNRIERDVEEIRQELAEMVPWQGGRLVSMWLSPLEPQVYRLQVFQYSTLFGTYHLGGYDPLVARENLDLAVNLEYSNIFRYELTPESLQYLGSWAVRYLVVPRKPDFPEILGQHPSLRLAYRDAQLEIWENGAALPFAYFVGPAASPAEVIFEPDGMRLQTSGRGGPLRVQVAPIPGYFWWADGQAMGPATLGPDRHLLLDVPAGTQEVVVRYLDIPFRLGLALSAACLLSFLAVALVRRQQQRVREGAVSVD